MALLRILEIIRILFTSIVVFVASPTMNVNENSNPCVATVDENGVPYSDRVKRLRIKSGKSFDDVCNLLTITGLDYEEVENFPGELARVLTLYEISQIGAALGVRA